MNRGRIGRQLSTLPMWETPIFKIHIQRDPHYFQSLLHIFNYQLPFSRMVMTPISVLWKGWALGLQPGLLCLLHISTLMWAFWARFWEAASRMVHISRKTWLKILIKTQEMRNISLNADFNKVKRLHPKKSNYMGNFYQMRFSWIFRFFQSLLSNPIILCKCFYLIFWIFLFIFWETWTFLSEGNISMGFIIFTEWELFTTAEI